MPASYPYYLLENVLAQDSDLFIKCKDLLDEKAVNRLTLVHFPVPKGFTIQDFFSTTMFVHDTITPVPYFPNLVHLHCPFNDLTSLPPLPNIRVLNCSCNRITCLPELPNVTNLDCSHNELKNLPSLPNISILLCYGNKIESLPSSLDTVQVLNCSGNNLDSLPELPKVIDLDCSNNRIVEYPALPCIEKFYCYTSKSTVKIIKRMSNKKSKCMSRIGFSTSTQYSH